MKINWIVRLKNPYFYVPLLLFIISTVGSVAHVTEADVASWEGLGKIVSGIVKNPAQLFSIVIALYGYIVDPTTPGTSDSAKALKYKRKGDGEQ